ncbi:MAG TPA: hypothetical protein V6C76_12390 [Drouetiella sp.]
MRHSLLTLKYIAEHREAFLLCVLCVASSFSVANAQLELRPEINGTRSGSQTAGTERIPIQGQPTNVPSALTQQQHSPSTATDQSQKQSIETIANELVDVSFTGAVAPSKKFKAVRIKVSNRSDTPIVFDGNRSAIVIQPGGQIVAKCISQKQLDTVGRPPTTFGEKVSADLKDTVTAAASVGVVQSAKTFAIQAGPIEKRYEYDRERQTNEESRFGQRLVYPGESSEGNIYFDKNILLDSGAIQIPVKTLYDASKEATLSKPIRLTTEGNRQ